MASHRPEFDVAPAGQSWRERVAALVTRYPAVSKKERQEILAFLRRGRHLDIGLLTASDKLRPQLDAFMTDHRRQLQIRAADIVWLIVVLTAALTVCALVWAVIPPRSM